MITGPKVNWSLIQMVPQSNQFNNEFAQFNLSSFCKILQDSSLRTIWHTGVFWTSVLNLSGCFEQERQWKLSSFSSLLFFSSPSLPPPALAETPISRRQRLLLLSSPTEQILPRFDVWRLLWLSWWWAVMLTRPNCARKVREMIIYMGQNNSRYGKVLYF